MDASRFQATMGDLIGRRKAMTIQLLAIDLGKQSFHLHGITATGVVISRKVSRAKLGSTVTELDPAVIAMEACSSAHHWGRHFEATGRQVRLINPPIRSRSSALWGPPD
jgi:transposase